MQHTVVGILILLSLAAVVAVAVKRVKIPYSTALLVCGLLASNTQLARDITLDPSVVFFVFLPTLLFQAAVITDIAPLRGMQRTLIFLTTVGVVVTVLCVGFLAHYLLGMPWIVALLFASLTAPTDTVSVLAVLREMSIPERLAALIEGESLFIGGTALLLFNTILGRVLDQGHSLAVSRLAIEFVWVALCGSLLGAALGYVATRAMRAIGDHLIEVLLTTILAYGTYIAGEWLGVSSSLAVVAAGLVVGNYGLKHAISPTTQLTLMGFWNYSAFVVNSLLFLICGLQVPLATLWQWKGSILLAYLTMHVGRSLTASACPLVARWAGEARFPRSWSLVMVWSDFYGSLSMALALALPHSVPWRQEIITITFGVVLLSLILQGVTLRHLIGFLKLSETPQHQVRFDACLGQIIAARGVQGELKRLLGLGLISRAVYDHLYSRYQVKASRTERRLKTLYEEHEELEGREYQSIADQMLRLERSLVSNAIRERVITEEAGLELMAEIDRSLTASEG